MKVFISSLIRGLEPLRDAAEEMVDTLGHEVIRAEDFEASPDSPQSACMAGVRESDVMVLILGSKYGYPQASGLSATHEEYREAREARPVLAFLEDGMDPEPEQLALIHEVQGWEKGHYTSSFDGAKDLRAKVLRGLHDFALANASAPLDEGGVASQSLDLVPHSPSGSGALLVVSVAGGPARQVLRPAELEDAELHRFLSSEALTGANSVLNLTVGTRTSMDADTVILRQDDGAFVSLSETGGIVVAQQALEDNASQMGIESLIEETVTERISRALLCIGGILDRVDQPRRLSHVSVTAALLRVAYLEWRTKEEQAQNPHTATIGTSSKDRILVQLSPPVRRRAALAHDTHKLTEDLAVRLRREVRP